MPRSLPVPVNVARAAATAPPNRVARALGRPVAGRAMPKGRRFPVPMLCTVGYGAPLRREAGDSKAAFMHRAAIAEQALQPGTGNPP